MTFTYSTPQSYLDVLDKICCAVGYLLGCLHKMPLGHRIGRLGAGYLAGVAEDAGVLGNHRGCGQHLLLAGLRVQEVLTCHGDGLRGEKKKFVREWWLIMIRGTIE